jgi:hypothetical protein
VIIWLAQGSFDSETGIMSLAKHAFWDRHGFVRGSDFLSSFSHILILNLPPA